MESNISEAYNRLSELYDKWYSSSSKKEKDKIEVSVFNIINNRSYIPDAIYLAASDGRASGLCQYGYFERDLLRLIDIIKILLQR